MDRRTAFGADAGLIPVQIVTAAVADPGFRLSAKQVEKQMALTQNEWCNQSNAREKEYDPRYKKGIENEASQILGRFPPQRRPGIGVLLRRLIDPAVIVKISAEINQLDDDDSQADEKGFDTSERPVSVIPPSKKEQHQGIENGDTPSSIAKAVDNQIPVDMIRRRIHKHWKCLLQAKHEKGEAQQEKERRQ